MSVYRFKTIILEDGRISLPPFDNLTGRNVEVTIRPIDEKSEDKLASFRVFLKKWRGVLQSENLDELKWQYLQEKYGLTDE